LTFLTGLAIYLSSVTPHRQRHNIHRLRHNIKRQRQKKKSPNNGNIVAKPTKYQSLIWLCILIFGVSSKCELAIAVTMLILGPKLL